MSYVFVLWIERNLFDLGFFYSWPFGQKLSGTSFILIVKKTLSNQNVISNKYSFLIGRFLNRGTKLVLQSFMTMRPGILKFPYLHREITKKRKANYTSTH